MKPYTIDDAEVDLREAIDRDDLEAINRLEKTIDRLEDKPDAATLHAAALWYAEQGLHVFPLQPGRKSPLPRCPSCKEERCTGPDQCGHDLCHGLLDATIDPARVREWWGKNPNRNIGIITGRRFDAVDIDGPLGQQSRTRHWEDIFSRVDADNIAKVLTPRPGGMHIWVPPTGDRNGTHIVPGVDYRGAGGYVVAPPSVIAPGGKDSPGTYRFLGTPRLDAASLAA